ncbi:hypothetical protein MRB53_028626 [Persea americana]|uniref:Uncharacterized protein n=1 Tax=Persea americana TaxID=3435 RepID=A0ACC2KG30_PERAE|nr:hypothetical protein MRB53_028626 [Persea americana]
MCKRCAVGGEGDGDEEEEKKRKKAKEMGDDANAMGNGCEDKRGPTWFWSVVEGCCVSLEVLLRQGDGPRLRWVSYREVVAAGDLEVQRAGARCCMCLEAAACIWRGEMERDGVRWCCRRWRMKGRKGWVLDGGSACENEGDGRA